MIETFLKKIVKNENPEHKDGMRKLILKEHLACILGIAIVSLILGIISELFGLSTTGFLVKALSSAFVIFIFSGSAFTLILFPICFFKILGQRRVNAVIIYEIWLAMSVLTTLVLITKHFSS